MTKLQTMHYGRATVEIRMHRPRAEVQANAGRGVIVESTDLDCVWLRVEVYTFTRHREGYCYSIVNGGGASGWMSESNFRNFVQTLATGSL